VINDLRALCGITKKHGVPFHTDAVQLFGKEPLTPLELAVDAFSVSFHKMGGPVGTGLLVLREALIKGYGLCPLICGTQNMGLRGGTEPIHNIAGSYTAMKHALERREEKNARMEKLREAAKAAIASQVPTFYLDEYRASEATAEAENGDRPVVVWVSPTDWRRTLPNTLFLSVHRPRFCNRAARAALEARGVIVAVGSACNSSSAEPSGVVAAIELPKVLQDGVLRISLGDDTTALDVKKFVRHFLAVITSEECLKAAAQGAAPAVRKAAAPRKRSKKR
jgi:cysteine desulfurase